MQSFATSLIAWQRRHGRHDLPWQGTRDPYRIWLSEVMLQQTQVATVIPYYERFLERYPTVAALAAASQEEVLELWSGLGYYARGRNLHAAAKRIAAHGFPRTTLEIAQLPGVGRSTAGAIAAFAFGERAAILDGNARRVLARCFALKEERALWAQAQDLLPATDVGTYTQALMDLGAAICTRTRPRCDSCPLARRCLARAENQVASFPAPRARRSLPNKQVTWLVLRHGREVLMEKRPPTGIWGGLWCFPEVSGSEEGKRLPTLEHAFTHFRLRIFPVLREVMAKPGLIESPGRKWMNCAKAASAAVPVPVRKLLADL